MNTVLVCAGCGYRRRYRTAALAAYHHPRHSCQLHRTRLARATRVTDRAMRRAADLGPKHDCQHPIARHQHGTRQGYILDRCRCVPCLDANVAYERERLKLKRYGRWTHRTDAAPVRTHLFALQAAGTSYKQVARLAGCSVTTLSQIMYGRPDRRDGQPPYTCSAELAQRVLAISRPDPYTLSDAARIDATGTRRRLQALVTCGWSQSKLAVMLGVSCSNFGRLLHSDRVHASTARAARALYEQLWDTPPPASNHRERISVSRSKHYAAQHGWLPPLAWDDDTIDQAELPTTPLPVGIDEVAVERAMQGDGPQRLTKAEQLAAILRLHELGLSDRQIAERLGTITASGVCIARNRAKAAA